MDVLTYQCPQCGAPLKFNEETQRWDCEFCRGSFDLDAVKSAKPQAEPETAAEEPEEETANMREYVCPQCGAQIITDETTAASFCVYCQNAAIFPEKLRGAYKPAKVIPFQKSREEAQQAFRRLCSKKPLLPKDFYTPDRIEKITGVYVPFWLFDCHTSGAVSASATRVTSWSDRKYRYTKTDFYRIDRAGIMDFSCIPADGSKKMENALMDSIEPYDFSRMVDFNTAYLSGFFAERYDEDSDIVFPRIKNRAEQSLLQALNSTISGYTGVMIRNQNLHVQESSHQNVLLPVWVLMSHYKDKDYLFAMNGQTGKIVGDLPVSIGKAAAWFTGILATVFILLFIGGLFL